MSTGTTINPTTGEDLASYDDHTDADVTDAAHDAGATLVLGGEIHDHPRFFYPVAVLEDVEPGMPAHDDELFGPVASIIRVASESRFGLGGGIISKNADNAVQMAVDEFDTGMVNINGYNLTNPQLPFGGVKGSGYGRKHGDVAIREFVNVNSVMVTES